MLARAGYGEEEKKEKGGRDQEGGGKINSVSDTTVMRHRMSDIHAWPATRLNTGPPLQGIGMDVQANAGKCWAGKC